MKHTDIIFYIKRKIEEEGCWICSHCFTCEKPRSPINFINMECCLGDPIYKFKNYPQWRKNNKHIILIDDCVNFNITKLNAFDGIDINWGCILLDGIVL